MYIRIKELRENKNLTQAETAKELGISLNAYSRYEAGKIRVPTRVFIKLADFYGTSVDYLLNLTNIPRPS